MRNRFFATLLAPPLAAIIALLVFVSLWVRRIALTTPTVAGITPAAWALLVVALFSGAGSMILIETAKRLLGLRGRFQRQAVQRWLDGREYGAFPEMVRALIRSESRADTLYLFDLAIEQVSAQLGAAADLAMTRPRGYTAFLGALSGVRGLVDEVAERYRQADERPDPEVEQARAELAHRVRTGLDLLQISVGQRWRRTVRTYAVALSGVLGFVITGFAGIPGPQQATLTLVALLFGGFFAWLTRDVVAAVERLRG